LSKPPNESPQRPPIFSVLDVAGFSNSRGGKIPYHGFFSMVLIAVEKTCRIISLVSILWGAAVWVYVGQLNHVNLGAAAMRAVERRRDVQLHDV
jgi:hypothetical protein